MSTITEEKPEVAVGDSESEVNHFWDGDNGPYAYCGVYVGDMEDCEYEEVNCRRCIQLEEIYCCWYGVKEEGE